MTIKALYVIWPDFEYIDKAINAGINALLVANQNLSLSDDSEHQHWGSYKDTVDILQRYRDTNVDLILVPTLIDSWREIPNLFQFDAGHRKYTKMFCPTCNIHVEDRFFKILELQLKYRITGIIWDLEHYGYKVDSDILRWTYDDYKPKYYCKCKYCNGLKENQWKYFQRTFKAYIKKFPITGQLVDRPWNFKMYPEGNTWLFTESTYNKRSWHVRWRYAIKTWIRYKLISKILWGFKLKGICPGAWAEKFTEKEYIDYLEYLLKNPFYSGYWIYTQMRFSSNTMHNPVNDEQPYYPKLMSDEFFKNLKILNDRY